MKSSIKYIFILSTLSSSAIEGRIGGGGGTSNANSNGNVVGNEGRNNNVARVEHQQKLLRDTNEHSNQRKSDNDGESIIDSAGTGAMSLVDNILINKSVDSISSSSTQSSSTSGKTPGSPPRETPASPPGETPRSPPGETPASPPGETSGSPPGETPGLPPGETPTGSRPLPSHDDVMNNVAPSRGPYADRDSTLSFCARHNKFFTGDCEQHHASLRGTTTKQGQHHNNKHHQQHHNQQQQEVVVAMKNRGD